jgi:hypothetical protein
LGVIGLHVGLGRAVVHGLLLLLVLRVGVLVVDGWLACGVGGLGVLLHGDFEEVSGKFLQYCDVKLKVGEVQCSRRCFQMRISVKALKDG